MNCTRTAVVELTELTSCGVRDSCPVLPRHWGPAKHNSAGCLNWLDRKGSCSYRFDCSSVSCTSTAVSKALCDHTRTPRNTAAAKPANILDLRMAEQPLDKQLTLTIGCGYARLRACGSWNRQVSHLRAGAVHSNVFGWVYWNGAGGHPLVQRLVQA